MSIFKKEPLFRGKKKDTIIDYTDDEIKDVLRNIFDGVYNKGEILKTLSIMECRTDDIKPFFDECGLEGWYYLDLQDVFRVMSANFIIKLELDKGERTDTITIQRGRRGKQLYVRDITDDFNSITDKFKDLLKQFNDARSKDV
ncbi:hypothetical protein BPT24_287 [Tenacibaculum phage pT24]|uniref:Uncharacterized protein n=1 Tax=Tenacibaculum phage pT24 TaxID=1880590 RepID=A0A1B4XX66_9CAUD|nr:hypothetical protein HYP10_gp241 [Tenacibaculum phage pT24]BAV39404.1 hypothetical protein BPT24_287 [Tenacibaculum phage pT24]